MAKGVGVDVHHSSVLSPFLFITVLVEILEHLKDKAPWTTLFADGLVLVGESVGDVQERLEGWRHAFRIMVSGEVEQKRST